MHSLQLWVVVVYEIRSPEWNGFAFELLEKLLYFRSAHHFRQHALSNHVLELLPLPFLGSFMRETGLACSFSVVMQALGKVVGPGCGVLVFGLASGSDCFVKLRIHEAGSIILDNELLPLARLFGVFQWIAFEMAEVEMARFNWQKIGLTGTLIVLNGYEISILYALHVGIGCLVPIGENDLVWWSILFDWLFRFSVKTAD